ncbi:MAG: hypothetical protein ACO1HP_14995 [Bacteroidota bacterium]
MAITVEQINLLEQIRSNMDELAHKISCLAALYFSKSLSFSESKEMKVFLHQSETLDDFLNKCSAYPDFLKFEKTKPIVNARFFCVKSDTPQSSFLPYTQRFDTFIFPEMADEFYASMNGALLNVLTAHGKLYFDLKGILDSLIIVDSATPKALM